MRKGKFREFKKFWQIKTTSVYLQNIWCFLCASINLKTYYINSFSFHTASENSPESQKIQGLDQVLHRVRYLGLSSCF